MEKIEKEYKRLKVLVVVLLICLIGITGYYYLDNKEANNNLENTTKTEETKQYAYSSMEGVYSITKEFDVEGSKEEGKYTLYLWKDGTFKCVYSVFAPSGYIGNYIIENDTIKLNYLFETTSGTGLTVVRGTKDLTIINNNSISFNDSKEYANLDFSGTLSKDASDKANNDLELYKLNEVLDNNDFFDNKASVARNNNQNN